VLGASISDIDCQSVPRNFPSPSRSPNHLCRFCLPPELIRLGRLLGEHESSHQARSTVTRTDSRTSPAGAPEVTVTRRRLSPGFTALPSYSSTAFSVAFKSFASLPFTDQCARSAEFLPRHCTARRTDLAPCKSSGNLEPEIDRGVHCCGWEIQRQRACANRAVLPRRSWCRPRKSWSASSIAPDPRYQPSFHIPAG